MDGSHGENPVNIGFSNRNSFKCESLSSACPRCPSGPGGHPSLCPPWCPCFWALPKSQLDSHRQVCQFSLALSRDSSEPLCGTHLAQPPFPRGIRSALMDSPV